MQLLEDDLEDENQKRNRVVILYVVGNTSSIGAIERFIASQWSFVKKTKVLFHNDGYFVILLNSNVKRDEVLMTGPYTINSRPIILRAWTAEFNEEVLKTIPLWVKLPN